MIDFFSVNLLALSSGIAIGWSSPIIPKLTNPNRTDENPLAPTNTIVIDEESWIIATFFLLSTCGIYPWIFISDMIGRKITLLIVVIPLGVSYIMAALANTPAWFLLARGFCGFANGATGALLLVYILEITSGKHRTRLFVIYNNFIALGILLSYTLGAYLSVKVFNFILLVVPALFLSLFAFFGIETPVYLLKRQKEDIAYAVLKKLRNGSNEQIQIELDELRRRIQMKNSRSMGVLVKAVTITSILAIFQQFSGVSVVCCFMEDIFETANSKTSGEVSAIIIGGIQLVASLFTHLFINHIPRKYLFIITTIGVTATQSLMGVYFYAIDDRDKSLWLPMLLTLALFVISYNCAFSVFLYTLVGKLFPFELQSPAVMLVGTLNYVTAFAVTVLFKQIMVEHIGYEGGFWIFAGSSLFCLLFTIVFVPSIKYSDAE